MSNCFPVSFEINSLENIYRYATSQKADRLLLRYNILKYKLSLSISLMLLVSKTLVFVKSTLRSQITTHEASLP